MVLKTKKIISYESSSWYIKLWRQRWYLYAILLYLKYYKLDIGFEYIMNEGELEDDTKEKVKNDWKEIKKHVELSKMYKFSTK